MFLVNQKHLFSVYSELHEDIHEAETKERQDNGRAESSAGGIWRNPV